MDLPARIERLLSPGEGLRCLPMFRKLEVAEQLRAVPREEWHSYYEAQLAVLERYVEPLSDERTGVVSFAELCGELARGNERERLVALFGECVPTAVDARAWIDGAASQQLVPAHCLFFTAAWLAAPVLGDADERARGRWLLAGALSGLGRPEQAVQVLEDYARFASSDYTDAGALADALNRPECPLRHLEVNNLANYLRTLAEAVGLATGRGKAESVRLLESFAGISASDYADPAAWEAALGRPACPIQGLDPDNRANYVRTLADALGFVPSRGKGEAARLLEAFAGLTASSYGNRIALAQRLRHPESPLQQLEPNNRVAHLIVLAEALGFLPADGPDSSVALLESYSGLHAADYEDSAAWSAAVARPDCPLRQLDPNNLANYVRNLAEVLGLAPRRGKSETLKLLEAYARFEPADYRNPLAVDRALSRPDCPLRRLEPNNFTNYILALAEALNADPRRGPSQAACLLQACAKLSLADIRSPVALTAALRAAECPLKYLEPNNRANFVRQFAETLAAGGDGMRGEAARLLESFAGAGLADFAAAPGLRDLVILNRLAFVHTWLQTLTSDDPRLLESCEEIVGYIRRHRNLPTIDHLHEFLVQAQRIWPRIEELILGRADALVDREARQQVTLRLLYLAEQMENRLLVEQLRTRLATSATGTPPATTADARRAGDWPFRSVWHNQPLPDWNAKAIRQWLDSYKKGLGSPPGHQSRVGGWQECEGPQPNGAGVDSAHHHLNSALDDALNELPPPPLVDLVPAGAVWVRTLFDAQGALRWWSWRSVPDGLGLLASGVSSPGAWQRLELANREFDLLTDCVWAAFEGVQVPPELEFLGSLVANQSSLDSLLAAESEQQMAELRRLVAQTADRIVALRQTRLRRLVPPVLTLLVSLFHREFSGQADAWSPAMELWATRVCMRAIAILHDGNAKANGRRRRELLDELSRKQLAVLQKELNLEPLAEHVGGYSGLETDVMFQVQGPLLASPLAWLPIAGEPLLSRVASTSIVFSLTLRDVAVRAEELRRASRATPRRQDNRLLFLSWEDQEARPKRLGFPLLAAGLRPVTAEKHWLLESLGDEPLASIANLRDWLSRREHRLLLIAAHGDSQQAGVRLACGLWRGEGVDLAAVELLILISCAVGRLEQDSLRELQGLCVRLAENGGHSLIAARWPVADLEAAWFSVELVRQFLAVDAQPDRQVPFHRARSFNLARRAALASGEISFHQMAAFEYYGLG